MWLAVLGALAVSVVAVTGALVFAVRRAIEVFRRLGALLDALGAAADAVSEAADASWARRASFGARAEPLDHSLARLRTSRSRLAVLLAAWSDARASVGRVAAVVPRK